MQSLKEIRYFKIEKGATVEFVFENGRKILGEISAGWFIQIPAYGNSYIFEQLEIPNKEDFVSKIVGYKVQGIWPEVSTEQDLKKVLDALLKVNKGISANNIITVRKKKSINLNFNV